MVDTTTASSSTYDLIVIGGGVVGLACLRAATLKGWKCVLVEAEADLLTHASGGNSGIVCTGVDAAAGTLERALIRDSISEFRPYCEGHNIPIRPCGSLVCLFPWDVPDAGEKANETKTDHISLLDNVLEESHTAGDTDAKLFPSGDEILSEKERNLSSSLLGAVHIPGEVVVDSWVYSISLAAHAIENGATIYTSFRADCISRSDEDEGLWTIGRKDENESSDVPLMVRGKAVVNATGSWSDLVEKSTHGAVQWSTKPRRGQYRVYDSDVRTQILHPLQPIPSQRTKGIFVFSTLHNQLVVGPTALDQPSRTDRSVDPEVARQLDDHIRRVIPSIDTEKSYVGDYVGIRPGTNCRDYQIHLNARKSWISVAGIRSTGLTASLGIGNYVTRLLCAILDDPPDTTGDNIQTSRMPTLEQLADDYVSHGDGCCEIHGRRYRVTHPLTKMGFESLLSKPQA
jgi:glycerol-3-phosphate dehydrogenase